MATRKKSSSLLPATATKTTATTATKTTATTATKTTATTATKTTATPISEAASPEAPRASALGAPPSKVAPKSRKSIVVAALRAALGSDLEAVSSAANAAHDAATHPEAKPENEKDTRALEAGYLAGAQSARAAQLQRAVSELDQAPLSAFSLVSLRETKAGQTTDSLVLLSPWGGGQKLLLDNVAVAVITPQSPLGQALAGQSAGDVVDVDMGVRVRTLTVLDVA
jgi:hypothetical protein